MVNTEVYVLRYELMSVDIGMVEPACDTILSPWKFDTGLLGSNDDKDTVLSFG